jgi:two-component system response regulator YesN
VPGVLIVDDEPDIHAVMTLFLEQAQVDVAGCARTADEAVRMTVERDPDVVIVDLRLRGGCELELVSRLHALGCRVVVFTALSWDVAELGLLHGAEAAFIKPEIRELVDHVAGAVAGRAVPSGL